MQYVISYDVVNKRRRDKLHKLLKGHLRWVQYSVFEGELTPRKYDTLTHKMLRIIDPTTDSIRIYPQCRRCCADTELMGVAIAIPGGPEDVVF